MKRITLGSGSLVTGDATVAALLDYTTRVAGSENKVTVEITVLQEDGETSLHTLSIGQATQFEVSDVDGAVADEDRLFPVPEIPQVGIMGVVEQNGDAGRTAQDIDAIMAELDEGLGQ